MFAPDRVKVPLPFLTKEPVPLITPEKVVEVLFCPAINWLAFSVMFPAPAIDPTVSPLARFRVAPLETETALVSFRADPPLRLRIPVLTVTFPLAELAPERVTVPAPTLVRAPLLTMFPLKVAAPPLAAERLRPLSK